MWSPVKNMCSAQIFTQLKFPAQVTQQDYRLGNRKFTEVADQEMLISTSSTLLHRYPAISNSCQDQFKLQFIIPEEKPSSQLKTAKSNLNNSISLSNTEAQAFHGEVIQKAVFFFSRGQHQQHKQVFRLNKRPLITCQAQISLKK